MSEFSLSRREELKKNNKLKKKTLMFFVSSVCVFMIVLIVIFSIMYRSAKKSVISLEQNHLQASASDIDVYFEKTNNAIIFSKTSIESGHEQGVPLISIKHNITSMTNTFLKYIDDTLAGLYGYIYGEYMDGSGWVPDDDYIATERPWYTAAVAKPDQLVYTAPYVDAESGNVCITIGHTLADDDKSVIAMDLTLSSLNQYISSLMTSSNAIVSAQIIDTGNAAIIASSRSGDVLNDDAYHSLSSQVTELLNGKSDYSRVKSGNKTYLVYRQKLTTGWYYIAKYDEAVLFQSLRYIYFISAFVIVLVMGFILAIYRRISAQTEMLYLQKYESDSDLLTDTRNEKSGRETVNKELAACHSGMFVKIELDDYNQLQKRYGVTAMNKLVIAMADKLSNRTSGNDIIYHVKDGEFCAFFKNVITQEAGSEKINAIFCDINDMHVAKIDCSKLILNIGAVVYDGKQPGSYEKIYRIADERCKKRLSDKSVSVMFTSF